MKISRTRWLLITLIPLGVLLTTAAAFAQDTEPLAPGDPIPEISCVDNYTAFLYAEGLSAPDGLAFAPDGVLYVAEESAGSVSAVSASGTLMPVMTGLSSPEGIAFDAAGTLYVVEDVANGRLLSRADSGVTTTIATGLDAPEGVVAAADGLLYITESNAQFVDSPLNLRSRVSAVSASGIITRLATTGPVISGFNVEFISFAGITQDADGTLFVTNETSGVTATYDVGPFTFVLTTTKSVFSVSTSGAGSQLLASTLIAPEGVRFADGDFPLFIVEEDIGDGSGRINRIAADGTPTPFCTGFGTAEDIVVDAGGWFYVSDDGNGRIVQLRPTIPTSITLHNVQTPHATQLLLLMTACLLALATAHFRPGKVQ